MRPYPQTHTFFKKVANYCLVALIGFAFLGAQGASLTGSYNGGTSWQSGVAVLLPGNLFNTGHFPLPRPFEGEQTPAGQEIPDESETNHTDVDWAHLLTYSFTQACIYYTQSTHTLTRLSGCLQSRAAVSLFVLHHSWKSYLL